MKTLKKISFVVIALVSAIQFSQAQELDYKGHRIDASGKVTDKEGKHIGSVSKEGVIKDATGVKVAHVDGTGTLIDAKTGKNLGKVGKNGNFVPYSSVEAWSATSSENGVCQIKDEAGKVKAVVHETYKNIGACAIHCLTHHMKHGEVMDEKKMNAALYICPMDADVFSDKAGKCSKCGMDLVKKNK
jgi:Heavy metal binding domain